MSIEDNKYPLEQNDVIELLQKYDITPTRQRVEIAGYLFQRPQHLSADHILDGVNADGHRVSRATVYNTVGLFARKGLVREVLIDRERVFYDSNNGPHHHTYNIDTGELSDVDIPGVDDSVVSGLPTGTRVLDTDIIVRVSDKS